MDAKDAAEYTHRAARAYEAQLRTQVERFGVPQLDPEFAGRWAATVAMAGDVWAEEVGPFYDTDGARIALGDISKQAVSQRVRDRRLLGLRLAADGSGRDRLVYPAWQFQTTVLKHLPTVLTAAGFSPGRSVTGWTIASWLVTADDGLDGWTPLRLLAANQREAVLARAADVHASLGVDERAAGWSTRAAS